MKTFLIKDHPVRPFWIDLKTLSPGNQCKTDCHSRINAEIRWMISLQAPSGKSPCIATGHGIIPTLLAPAGYASKDSRNLTAPEALETLKNPEQIHVKKGGEAEIL
ncbi:hypothetical protein [Thermococcus atlanticus]